MTSNDMDNKHLLGAEISLVPAMCVCKSWGVCVYFCVCVLKVRVAAT